jgi:hypothetical protein
VHCIYIGHSHVTTVVERMSHFSVLASCATVTLRAHEKAQRDVNKISAGKDVVELREQRL